MNKKLYTLVLDKIDATYKGVFAGNSVLNYIKMYYDDTFKELLNNDSGWSILNGGTSNNGYHLAIYHENKYSNIKGLSNNLDFPIRINDYSGSMEKNWNFFIEHNIKAAPYFSKDFNNSLVAISFIVNEPVFNYRQYLDFPNWLNYNLSSQKEKNYIDNLIWIYQGNDIPAYREKYKELFGQWVKYMKSTENAYLRIFLNQFSLI